MFVTKQLFLYVGTLAVMGYLTFELVSHKGWDGRVLHDFDAGKDVNCVDKMESCPSSTTWICDKDWGKEACCKSCVMKPTATLSPTEIPTKKVPTPALPPKHPTPAPPPWMQPTPAAMHPTPAPPPWMQPTPAPPPATADSKKDGTR